VAIGYWHVEGDDGGVRHWGGKPGISDDLAVVGHYGTLAVERGEILASAALVAWLIVEHKLWERPQSSGERDRAVLYNASTVITLTIGVVIFHAALFVLLLLTTWWTLPPQLVAKNIGHPLGVSSLLMMAWLAAAVATLGGALGSGMEDDQAVKAAAYGVRQRQRFDQAE
jgi:hypothetical protein